LGKCPRGYSFKDVNEIYKKIGNAYEQLNQPEKAIEYFKKLI